MKFSDATMSVRRGATRGTKNRLKPSLREKRSLKVIAPSLQEGEVDRAVKQIPRRGESSRHKQTPAGFNTAGKEKGWEK